MVAALEQPEIWGQPVAFMTLPAPLWLSWCDVVSEDGKARFYVSPLSPLAVPISRDRHGAATIEAFRLPGIKMIFMRPGHAPRLASAWIFLACLAYSFCSPR